MIAEYYRYISYLDTQIGRVLDALEASPHAKNTIVVFAADSGVARGSHGLIGKQNLYEHSLRVPLIIAGPGIPAGRTTDAMCYLYDVLPTLGALCGVPAPPASEGLDLSAVAARSRPAGAARVAVRLPQRAAGHRDDRWKLIRYPQVDTTQLFDLQADPCETARPGGQARIRRTGPDDAGPAGQGPAGSRRRLPADRGRPETGRLVPGTPQAGTPGEGQEESRR